MKKFCLMFAVLAALAAFVANGAPVFAANPAHETVAPSAGTAQPPHAGVVFARPTWTYANAFWRTREWIEYDAGRTAYEPGKCEGPFENGHGVTQWACHGLFPIGEGYKYWQVNIDAYGVQTYDTYGL